ncbi:MAG: EpsI family protein [Pseudomonadota bacterium]
MTAANTGRGWRVQGGVTALLILLLLVLYRDTTLHVIASWQHWAEYYSHGYLALAIGLYLVYVQRARLARIAPCAEPRALAAVAVSCLLWLVGALAGVLLLQTLALPLLVLSVIWSLLGTAVAGRMLLPLTVILFALPVWEPLLPLLQDMTVRATYVLARLLDVPAYRDGRFIILPTGRFSVDEECSGLAYLLAALTLGLLYASLYHRSLRGRVLVVTIAAAAAIAANILRVVIVVYRGHVTGMQTSLVTDHFYLGWYLFGGLALLLLLADMRFFRVADTAASQPPATAASGRGCGYRRFVPVALAALGLLVATPVLCWQLLHRPVASLAALPALPAGAGGWSGPWTAADDWNPVYQGAVEGMRQYRKDGRTVYLYVGYYPVQQQGSELIYYRNSITDGRRWKMVQQHATPAAAGTLRALEQSLQNDTGGRRLVWYWYVVADREVTDRMLAKVMQVIGLVTGRPQSAVIAIAADYADDAARTRSDLADFAAAMAPALAGITNSRGGSR